jgi:Ala-tRNA(Pro) deacylase
MLAQRLKEYLDCKGVSYSSLVHSQAFTAQEVAASAHVSGRSLAKTVIIQMDGDLAMAVLPANRKIILQDLHDVTGADQIRFATEKEFKARFPDCETGATPPFGNLYGMEVFVARSLADEDEIAFNAGTHTDVVRMKYADFDRLVHPTVLSFTT